ncbi:AAA domain-containing protein [Fervidobacterium gondwanense DSM 13020]|uniref:AAA domain-containing protein n=2 Tax=Fervidobacterium gondwanense TaxID=44754 RepID=A0A1M7T2I7_FERGO|nr:AAA domain-containing protein [Fervidobacterium gondwanense DSM 13020]
MEMEQAKNETIINYIAYLRDISRKIGTKTDFAKIFTNALKRRGMGSYVIPISNSQEFKVVSEDTVDIRRNSRLYEALLKIYPTLEKYSDKKLFLGVGGVFGQRKYAGPFLVAECEIEAYKGSGFSLYIDVSSSVLNYDLISKLLDKKRVVADDEEEYVDPELEKEIEAISDIEDKLSVISGISELLEFGQKAFKLLQDSLNDFKDIFDVSKTCLINLPENDTLHSKDFEDHEWIDRLDFLYKSSKILFLNEGYLFMAQVPNEISTYQSLSRLIDEVRKNESFENRVLEKLLNGSFFSDIQRTEYEPEEFENISTVIEKLMPIPLSPAQVRALQNAFSHDMSYIQGPPGTGKSHTISAMVLAAILTGRKVFVVSQKPPAVKVVKEKVEGVLKDNDSNLKILPLIYFDKQTKADLKDSLKSLLNEYSNPYYLESRIKTIRTKKQEIENQLQSKITDLNRIQNEYEESLRKQKHFINLSNELQKMKDKFRYAYNYDLSKEVLANVSDDNLKKISKLSVLARKLDNISENRVTILYKINLGKVVMKISPVKLSGRVILNILKRRIFHQFLQDIINVGSLNLSIRRTTIKDPAFLQEEISRIKKELWDLKRHYIVLENQVRILEGIRTSREQIEYFSKLLSYKKPTLIKEYQSYIDWEKILEVFPVWISEIRNLTEILPVKANMFDLVVVDEASQVNLAEIIPAFYRGKKICIVGDHKQLNLNATGLDFLISKNLDRLTWEKYRPNNLTYQEARAKQLTVTTSSILDFIMQDERALALPRTMLDEHFRSLPALAKFNNEKFYEGKLKIMTETPEKISLTCFFPIKVNGRRQSDKTVIEEAEKVIEIITELIKYRKCKDFELHHLVPKDFTIGVVSFIRNQVELIKDLIYETFDPDTTGKHDIITGTPEELQGHERDIMILSLALDESSSRSSTFYENKNRFNVATSRAKYVTFVVYSSVPDNFALTRAYFSNFGFEPNVFGSTEQQKFTSPIVWKLDLMAMESEFEKIVFKYLNEYIQGRKEVSELKIFNQVKSCGKRLDFVVYNPRNGHYVAVEVDGVHHFVEDGRNYSESHIERMEMLRRAGWKIINTPYYKWYNHGWLDENSEILKREIERIYKELDKSLGIRID